MASPGNRPSPPPLLADDAEADAARLKAALLGLARESERARLAWSRRLEEADDRLTLSRERDRIVVAAPRLSAYDESTRVRLLHRWSRALGAALGCGGARIARSFLRRARSGASVDLGDGMLLRREYEAWVLERGVADPCRDAERPLAIAAPGSGATGPEGEGTATIGGRRYRITWGASPAGPGERASFCLRDVEFPVVVRGRRPGDRLRRAAGRRSLKRLFADHRVPRSLRDRWPIVADARGVLWVPGVERSVRATSAATWCLLVESPADPMEKTETGD
jgi:tRNA(Ile)-lysidine synthetase-like protein